MREGTWVTLVGGQFLTPYLAHGNQGRITGRIQILNQQLDTAGDDTVKKQTVSLLQK